MEYSEFSLLNLRNSKMIFLQPFEPKRLFVVYKALF